MMLGMAASGFTAVPVLLRLPSTGWGFVASLPGPERTIP